MRINISNVRTENVMSNKNKYYESDLTNNENKYEQDVACTYTTCKNDTMEYATYSKEKIVARANDVIANRQVQNNLKILGFYSVSTMTDGDLTSEESKKAIKNFQRTYGLTESGKYDSNTAYNLTSACNRYESIKSSDGLKKLCEKYSFDSEQIRTINMGWTYLKQAMHLPDHQAAAVMGNIFQESSLRCSVSDGRAYGIMQWQNARLDRLKEFATNEMGNDISDINVQLGFMREESEKDEKENWDKFKLTANVENATAVFFESIERANDITLSIRCKYAQEFYDAFSC